MVNGGPDFKIFSLIICIALILKYLFLSTVTEQFSSTCCLIHRVLVVQCWTLPPFLEVPGFLEFDRSNSYVKLSLLIWYFRRTEDTSPYCLSFLLTSSFFLPPHWMKKPECHKYQLNTWHDRHKSCLPQVGKGKRQASWGSSPQTDLESNPTFEH